MYLLAVNGGGKPFILELLQDRTGLKAADPIGADLATSDNKTR